MILQRSRNSSRGVTLIELVITIVIISVALVASLSSFSVITGRNSNVLVQSRALDLAQLYMDEVLSKNFDDATGSGGAPTYTGNCRITDDGESRDNYDDVDDFNGLNESPATINSNLAALYNNYTVTVSVSCDGSVGANTNGSKLVQITITDPIGNSSVVSAYKGNF